MMKFFVIVGMIFSLCTMAGCEVEEMSSLRDLSKPYTGVYECEQLLLGGEDALGGFSYIRLELEYSGGFTLSYETEAGIRSEWGGTYAVDTEREEITLSAESPWGTLHRTYRFEDGSILLDENFAGRSFFAEFKM